MSLLQTLGKGQGLLKAGFLGFQGSGKTKTAVLLAIAVRRFFKLEGPVAFVDTENATEYIAPTVVKLTGKDLIGLRTRNFDELCAVGEECVQAGVSVLVADSMTHFWRSLCDSYLAGINQARAKYNKRPKTKLEFQDWGQVKGEWARWTDFFLNSNLHVIICGRAGFEYDMQKDEDTGRNELVKTGVKMKTEAEFGFEPSLLVQMEMDQEPLEGSPGKFRQARTATVLKDRFGDVDGKVFTFGRQPSEEKELEAVWNAFSPHVQRLKPGTHSTVATKVAPMEVDDEGNVEWAREKQQRTIYSEEIHALLLLAHPSQTAEDKTGRFNLMQEYFGTRSWEKISSKINSIELREGMQKLRAKVDPSSVDKPVASEVDDGGDLGPQKQSEPAPAAVAPAAKTETQAPKPETKLQTQAAPAELPLDTEAPAPILPDALLEQLQAVIGTHGVAAVKWLRSPTCNGKPWIGPTQALEHLSEEHARKLIKQSASFIKAITAVDKTQKAA